MPYSLPQNSFSTGSVVISLREMSKSLVQPTGQKRLTNIAIVRLKKHGVRYGIACYKNKVRSWRAGVEKDLDEVLPSLTVYSDVSRGIIANSSNLSWHFGTNDHTKICLEILEKGELQVSEKERGLQLSNQFRDIATIVMQKTINPETRRPYTISMVERLMREIHFSVDPNSSSKKQSLQVIRHLQKQFPIKRSPMRLGLTITRQKQTSLMDKLAEWKADILSEDGSGSDLYVVFEVDPSFFRNCNTLARDLHGILEIIAVSAYAEGDIPADDYHNSEGSKGIYESGDKELRLVEKMQKQKLETSAETVAGEDKQHRCSTCSAMMCDVKQYREHFKSDWHKHNLQRKARQLPPISAEDCMTDVEIFDSRMDLKDYCF